MSILKKFAIYTLAALTLGTALGINPAPAAAANAGDLIKKAAFPAVYYLGSNMKPYVFPLEYIYKSQYKDFSSVKVISDSELESYLPLGGNVTVRPGTYLLKIEVDPKVYAVEPGGVLRWVKSEAVAKALWGDQWYLAVRQVPDALFVNYTVGSDLAEAKYPVGSLVKMSGGDTIYYIAAGMVKRPIADYAAFNANRFMDMFVHTASDLSAYTNGSSITGYESEIATVAGPEVGSPSASTGTLSVKLSSMTPAAAIVVANAQRVPFTLVELTASNEGMVTIDSLTVERMGISQDSNISDAILIDYSTGKQLGNEKSINSLHRAVFNDDIEIAAGQTKKIMIAANMNSTLQSGELVSLGFVSAALKGTATLSGSPLPVVGNAMTMNTSISIGTVTVAAGGLTPSASTEEVGTENKIFTSARLTVNGTEDYKVESIRFYQNGTAADTDVKDLELVMDGSVIGGPKQVSNKEVMFDFASPVTIKKGTNKEFSLRGDIASGSSRTINFVFEKKTDVRAKGQTYGFYANPSYPNSSTPYFDPSDTTTISSGLLSASKAVISSTNVAEGAQQQELGAFFLQAQGEPVNVERIVLIANATGTGNELDITNVTIYDPNGAVVGGPVDPVTSGFATSTDTFTVPVGKHKYTIKGDLNTDFAGDDTIQMSVHAPGTGITAKGDATNNSITATPSGTITLDTVTVKVGNLGVKTSSSPAAQNVIAGSIGFTFANFVLDATNSGEDVRVNQLQIRHKTSASNKHSDVTNITLYDGSTALNTPQSGESGTSTTNATSTITLNNPLVVKKGTAKTITLKGDVSGSATNNSTQAFSLVTSSAVTAVGADTANSITPSTTNSDGQTMTVKSSGTINMFNAGATPLEGWLAANTTGNTIQLIDFDVDYEDVEVQKMAFTITDQNSGVGTARNLIDTIYVYDGATMKGSVPVVGNNATVTLTDLIVPGNGKKTLTVKMDLNEVGENKPGTSGDGFKIQLTNTTLKGVSSGSTSLTKTGEPQSNRMNVAKTLPNVSAGSVSGTLANGANVPIARVSIGANANGDILLYKLAFQIATTTATVKNFKLYEDPSGSAVDLTNNGGRPVDEMLGGAFGVNITFNVDGFGGERRTIGAGQTKVYELRGDVSGVTTGASVTVTLRGDGAYTGTMPNTASGVDSGLHDNFIWSDSNYGSNSTTATTTKQWFNGYKIYPTTTLQTLSK